MNRPINISINACGDPPGRPQGSPPLIRSTPAPTMTAVATRKGRGRPPGSPPLIRYRYIHTYALLYRRGRPPGSPPPIRSTPALTMTAVALRPNPPLFPRSYGGKFVYLSLVVVVVVASTVALAPFTPELLAPFLLSSVEDSTGTRLIRSPMRVPLSSSKSAGTWATMFM